jgi:hypothetical protein
MLQLSIDDTQSVMDLHNIKSGRIFILGNGPSLLQDDLTPLKDEATFTCNAFLRWQDRPWNPTYNGVTDVYDAKELERCAYRGEAQDTKMFHIGWPGDAYPHNDAFLWVEKAAESVHMDVVGFAGLEYGLPPIPTGRTSPLTNAQLAAWMGYREFYFLGIEQTTVGYVYDPEATITMSGGEFKTDNPKKFLAVQRCAHRMRADIEAAGGTIYDCTPGGLLNISGKDTPRRGARKEYPLEYKPLKEVLEGV